MSKTCGHLVKCGCESYLTTPPPCPTPEDCPEAQPCSEVFPAECIIYTSDDIGCTVSSNPRLPGSPTVSQTVVTQNSSVSQALQNIVNYFCSLASLIPITVVEAGDNVEVTSDTVDNITTYTVNSTCCSSIVYYGYGEGEIAISLITYPLWDILPVLSHGDLAYTFSEAGLYKVTLDIEWAEEDEFANAFVGISINGANPITSPFSQSLMGSNMSKTFHFILTGITAGDDLRVVFLGNVSGVILVNRVKLIIEK